MLFKLQKMGIETSQEQVYTSGMTTAAFLHRQKTKGTAFVIGEGGLPLALQVVGGKEGTLSYEMFEVAHRCIAEGAGLISTKVDTWCPTDEGPRPGCGAIVALLETTSGRTAYHVGKPNPFMMRAARKRMGLSTDQITMIGDTMETDLPGATDPGSQFVLVRIVSTKRTHRADSPCKPTCIVESIAERLPTPAGTR